MVEAKTHPEGSQTGPNFVYSPMVENEVKNSNERANPLDDLKTITSTENHQKWGLLPNNVKVKIGENLFQSSDDCNLANLH